MYVIKCSIVTYSLEYSKLLDVHEANATYWVSCTCTLSLLLLLSSFVERDRRGEQGLGVEGAGDITVQQAIFHCLLDILNHHILMQEMNLHIVRDVFGKSNIEVGKNELPQVGIGTMTPGFHLEFGIWGGSTTHSSVLRAQEIIKSRRQFLCITDMY